MRLRCLQYLVSGLALAGFGLVSPLQAMTFTLVEPVELPGFGPRPDHMILGRGPIEAGDVQVFEGFMAQLPPTDIGEVQWGIALDSPGGNLQEGVRLGEAFRAHLVTTVVLNGQACESACAVAYLGGAAQYATAEGVVRILEPGGRLGFHGISVSDDAVSVANDVLDLARTTNAVIRDYAIRMGVDDDGLVQSLFNTPPETIEYIDTPREILGLRVSLAVDEIPRPEGWAVNVCHHAVAGMLQPLDPLGPDERVSDQAERIGSVEAFRQRLLEAKYPDASLVGAGIYAALGTAPASTAADILAGRSLYLDLSPADIWQVGLGRGAGFYYDLCFAIAGDMSLTAVVVDQVGGEAVTERYGPLYGFPPDRPLW